MSTPFTLSLCYTITECEYVGLVSVYIYVREM